MTTYRLKAGYQVREDFFAEGTIFYKLLKHDYGANRDEECFLGTPCHSVTLDPTGDYPFFTIPQNKLEDVS